MDFLSCYWSIFRDQCGSFTDGSISRILQKILYWQTWRKKTAVAKHSGTLCCQSGFWSICGSEFFIQMFLNLEHFNTLSGSCITIDLIPWLKKIIWVIGVLRRTLVSDWCFDNRCGSHRQSFWQQSFSALQSPRWSFSIKVCYSWAKTIFLIELIF